MEQRKINPWKWQDQFGFSQAVEVSNASRVLYCAGQASVDDNGNPVHVGDMRKQIEQAFGNLKPYCTRRDTASRTSCGSTTTRPMSTRF